jgi:hypothetical protein
MIEQGPNILQFEGLDSTLGVHKVKFDQNRGYGRLVLNNGAK